MFYNEDINVPLSIYLNSPDWGSSPLAQLPPESNLEALNFHTQWWSFQSANFAWRVVGAYYPNEDSTMTQFRAYGMHGEHLPYATFGVNYAGAGQISVGGFRYPPWKGNQYYTPRDNQIHTPETGGYWVEVLDTEYPSEAMKFGLDKNGQQHRALVISFRLMPFDWQQYPNDV